MKLSPKLQAFREELEVLINKHSLEESGGCTPDYILADYLLGCLKNFGSAVDSREIWFGRHGAEPDKPKTKPPCRRRGRGK